MKAAGLFSMIKNRLNREEVYSKADYWDSKATEYAGDAVSMWPNNRLNSLYHREQLELLDELLPEIKGVRLLDCGCGTGRLSRFFAERGALVDSFDFSEKSIDIARSITAGKGNPSYRVLSVFDLEATGEYDVVVCWGFLTVACKDGNDLHRALSRLRGAVKEGGQVFILEPIHKGFLHRVLNMNLATFTSVMEDAGLDVLRTQELHFWPARLALAYLPLPELPTQLGYQAGQWLMDRIGRGGDYKVITATRS